VDPITMDYSYDRRCASRGGACDSSQMSSVLCHDYYKEVQEEVFVKEEAQASDAVPFEDDKDKVIAIINGKIANADEVLEHDILIEDGKISKVGKDIEIPEEAQIIDAKEKYVLPGLIDYDARLTERTGLDAEKIAERTKFLVQGGTTTFANLLQNPDFEKASEFLATVREEENQLFCNMVVKLPTHEADDVSKVGQELGVTTFQIPAEEVFVLDDEEIIDLLKALKGEGRALNVDVKKGALDDTILNGNSIMTPNEDLEEVLVRKICSLALQVDVPVCVLNVCSPDSLAVLADYQTKGATVYGEVLTGLPTSAPWDNSNLLMSSYQAGLHTDSTVENDVEETEDWMSIIYHEMVGKERFGMSKLVELTSTNPAKLLNLFPQKGVIKENSDADLVILDPMKSHHVTKRSSSVFSLPQGSDVYGAVDQVFVGGKLVVSDGQVRPMAKWGNYVSLRPFPVKEEAFKESLRKPLERIDRPRDNVQDPKDGRKAWDKRKCVSQGEIFDRELGIYQRPLSAHGVRNQQDSTFTVKTFF